MDTKTLEIIKNYSIKEYSKSVDKFHDLKHIERVVKNASWIVRKLKMEDLIDINLLNASCYLHDILIANRNAKNNFSQLYNNLIERSLNRKYMMKILDFFDLDTKEKQILSVAIINHPNSIPFRILNRQGDLYTKILQDADSLDYISLNRQQNLIEEKGKLLNQIANKYIFWIRKNIKKYLNFPELAFRLNGGLISAEDFEF